MKLNQFIAQNSKLSRRKADELIKTGQVKFKRKITLNPSQEVNPLKDRVEIDRKVLKAKNKSPKIYLALNKPHGILASLLDELKRPTVMKLVPPRQNLRPVGLMDREAEGLLLFTNDGKFINKYSNPKSQKEYCLTVEGKIEEKDRAKLEKIFGKTIKINILKAIKKETILNIIFDSQNRIDLRKTFSSINHPIKHLQRIRIDNIRLGSLKRGKYRLLTPEEINAD